MNRTAPSNQLTLMRLLVLVTCLAVGLAVFSPGNTSSFDWKSLDDWQERISIVLMGLTLAGPMFAWSQRRRDRRHFRAGTLLAAMLGLGVLLMIPPQVLANLRGEEQVGTTAYTCLLYVLPLLGLWFVLAASIGGLFRWRNFTAKCPWSERFGWYLAVLWAPWGVRILYMFYADEL